MTDTYNKKPCAVPTEARPESNQDETNWQRRTSGASSSETANSAKPLGHFSPSDAVHSLGILNTIFSPKASTAHGS